jgi:predicted aspartyl protease
MGNFQVAVQVGNLQAGRSEFIEALVDTGASHSIFPAPFLQDLGIVPDEPAPFRLADERLRDFEVGTALVTLYGQSRYTRVVFGDPGMRALLGAITLEEFRLGVDPVGKRLIPVPGLLMSMF